MANEQNLIPAKKGEVRNPKGKPKGTKHISTHIQNLLEDENFTIENWNNSGKKFEGVPIQAIITVAIWNALQGDKGWAEWLAKYGYGNFEQQGNNINVINAIINKYGGKGKVIDVPRFTEDEGGSS